jgi:hypothetical protein
MAQDAIDAQPANASSPAASARDGSSARHAQKNAPERLLGTKTHRNAHDLATRSLLGAI